MDLPSHELLAHTAFTLEEHREVGGGHPLDRVAQRPDRGCGADDRCRAVALQPRAVKQPGACRPRPASVEFQHERADMRGQAQHLKIPFTRVAFRIERHLEHSVRCRIGSWHFERHRLGRAGSLARAPPAAVFAQVHGLHPKRAAQGFLERPAHERDIEAPIERSRPIQ